MPTKEERDEIARNDISMLGFVCTTAALGLIAFLAFITLWPRR